MSTYPRMMYKDWPEYKIAHTEAEGEAFKKKGYVFEAWGALVEEEYEPPPKSNKCPVCKRDLKKFSHVRCADAAGKTTENVVVEREEKA